MTLPSTGAAGRFNTLDAMRGLAAIAVMTSHYTSHRLFGGAALAVDLLFCLSGFALAFSYQARLRSGAMSVRDFACRRLIRLYPMFQLGIALGALCLAGKVAAGQSDLGLRGALDAVALNALDLPYFGHYYLKVGADALPDRLFPANVPAWSLFFQLVTNALFAVWGLRRAKTSPLLPALLAALALVLYVRTTHQTNVGWEAHYFFGGFPRALFGLFSGAGIYFALDHIRRRVPAIQPLYPLALAFALLCYDPHWQHWNAVPLLFDTLLLVPLLVTTGIVAQAKSAALRRLFAYLGWISYPLYCLHFPVLAAYTLATHNAPVGTPGALICAVLALALAHLAARYIDEPLRARLTRATLPQRAATIG